MAKEKKVSSRGARATAKGGRNANYLSNKGKKRAAVAVQDADDNMLTLRETLWQWVASIPPGRVATYGQLARLAGFPRHARYVGTTLKHLPRGTTLPWFRVLRGSGELAFPPGSADWKRQKGLLEDDGVIFKGMKVSLGQYQWDV